MGRAWTVFLLGVVAMLSAVDRNILAVLLVPIQDELKVSDTAMGALSGTTIALVYATVALPLGRLADRANRRNILAVAVAVWSAATAACGAASSFVHLFLARIAVGGAEAAQPTASLSMIGDLYPAARRGAAISVMVIGSTLGYSLGAYVAGVINDAYGWRVAMMAVGVPGLLVALVVWLTVREPVRGVQDGGGGTPEAEGGLGDMLRRCGRIRTLYPLILGMIFLHMMQTGWLTWIPAFLMRVHNLSATKMSAIFALIVGAAALANAVAGVATDRLARRGARWRLYSCAAVIAVAVPALAASSLVESLQMSIVWLLVYTLSSGGLTTMTMATYVSVSPPSMRAFVAALVLFCSSVIGGGSGPLIFGAVNDLIIPAHGDQALRYSLLLGPVLLALAGILFLVASRTVDADTKSVGATIAK